MDERAQRFWDEFEAETGERVESRAMGAWLAREGSEEWLWGLLVLTDKSFRFRHLPSDNWLSSLLRFGRRESEAPKREEVSMAVARGEVVAVVEPRRGFLARAFGPAFAAFDLVWREGEAERRARFQVDPSADLLAKMRALPPRGAAT